MRPTISLRQAAKVLCVGESTAYAAVRAGKFPIPVLHVGGRIIVPTAPLLEALGIDELPDLEGAA
nr:MAG TPA_asm: Pyocin activator protein PrtN [Caudoviricetes sp.]